jgi:kinesin family protein C2/C3
MRLSRIEPSPDADATACGGRTGATGLTLTEAQNINNSLLSLGNVISALVSGGAHVPYRNSKLTMLLQDSLGGDAKALMMCNLAPSTLHASETLSSLQFAQKVSVRRPRFAT